MNLNTVAVNTRHQDTAHMPSKFNDLCDDDCFLISDLLMDEEEREEH